MARLIKPLYIKDLPNESDIGLKRFYLDKEAIEEILLNDIINHLKFLFPNAKIKGNKFYIGNIHGDKGDSLVITLSGQHKGKWKDFSTNEHGDIFTLFACHFNLDINTQFKALLQRLSQYLGLSQSEAKPLSQAEIISIRERQEESRLKAIEAELELTLKMQETALRLWNEAICINHPTAQCYLQARGLNISFNKSCIAIHARGLA